MNTPQSDRLRLVAGEGQPAGVGSFLAQAVSDVVVMSAGDVRFHQVDRDNLLRGVRYRVLFPDAQRLSIKLGRMSLAGATVRTDVEVPLEAIVIDGSTVLLPGRTGRMAAFRLPGVVTATLELFERIWSAGVPLTPLDDAEDETLNWRERELVTLLYTGHTDESAALKMGISVRTVRRTVADIMNRLGARSRFQAGAKAASRGWLLSAAS